MMNSDTILGKVERDFQLNFTGFEGDAYEWIGEAIMCIGTDENTYHKMITLDIVDKKVKLPCAAEYIKAVYLNGDRIHDVHNARTIYAYDVIGKYLHTSSTTGKITLVYEQYKADCKGMLIFPDIYELREALTWYVMYRLLLRGSVHTTVDVKTAKKEWEHFRDSAMNALILPNPAEMEFINDSYHSSIPNYRVE